MKQDDEISRNFVAACNRASEAFEKFAEAVESNWPKSGQNENENAAKLMKRLQDDASTPSRKSQAERGLSIPKKYA
jgi:formiminotetrahydrofolate cyclodeaminase